MERLLHIGDRIEHHDVSHSHLRDRVPEGAPLGAARRSRHHDSVKNQSLSFQLEIELHRLARSERNGLLHSPEPDALDRHGVGARRHVPKRIGSASLGESSEV